MRKKKKVVNITIGPNVFFGQLLFAPQSFFLPLWSVRKV